MQNRLQSAFKLVPALAAVLLSSACVVSDDDKGASAADSAALATPAPGTGAPGDTGMGSALPMDSAGSANAATPVSDMRVEVDITARKLRVYKGQDSIAAYPVAVGSEKWPTKTGEWRITQVVFNPEWTPPDESWAEEREPRKPGDPKNPLGRAQLVYDPPRSIHGTNAPSSIGKAVSHGSIRLSNDNVLKLGRQLMESAGVTKDSAWFRSTRTNRSEKQIVDLPGGVPIRVF
ncbi:MAG TPA: L,D-transpeptidase [Gemmatimonadaceae bacterium]|nr:L,D-transpeptidase [Gemmatimonadaceae bacterium]